MKKTLLLATILFLLKTAAAQSRFEFGIYLYPNISSAIVMGEGLIADLWREVETSKFSYSAGAFVRLPLRQKWGIAAGANFVNTGYATKKTDVALPIPEPGSPESIKINFRKTALEIPLLLDWAFVHRAKWKLYAVAGPSLWLNLADDIVEIRWYENADKKKSTRTDESAEFRQVNGILTAGLGWRGQLAPALSLFVQPSYQIALQGIAKDVALNRRLTNFGLATGLIFK